MQAADVSQRIPVLLFACVHFLLLNEPDEELAHHFPNLQQSGSARSPKVEPAQAFVGFVLQHLDDLAALLATRSTQTNEVGRCNWFLFPFAMIADEVGSIARVDVGSSAGLTLLFPEIDFDIGPGEPIGGHGTLLLRCRTRGHPPRPDRVPHVVWSKGFDSHPVNLLDEDHVRWLEACVWPEQIERFERLVKAIEVARRRGISVERGDAVADIERFLQRASEHGHPVVTTSWVMNYLTPAERVEFLAQLDAFGAETDMSWVIAESPQETPELPVAGNESEDITVISLVTWRNGRRKSVRLATAHPHGDWINWGS